MASATKVILIIEYDGTGYHGFQFQAKLPTIQAEVERAWGKLTGERRRVIAASRTDAGVHARGQVVSLRTGSSLPEPTFVSGLNHYLPEAIAVKNAYRVGDTVDVRRVALSREYSYCILNSPTRSPIRRNYCHPVAGRLDIGVMNEACRLLIGEHDLISFASQLEEGKRGTVKKVYRALVLKEQELVVFNIVANSFLPHQVRNTVGVLIAVGQGRVKAGEICRIMEAKKPGLAGPIVPAAGLCLVRVNYPVPFEEMK
ncbi:tRNA pseudouridine(38-40) synthase TruA [Chloroflexota bacterium]